MIVHCCAVCICLQCSIYGTYGDWIRLGVFLIRDKDGYVFVVTGILRGYDQLMNLVIDETQEHLRGMTKKGTHIHKAGQATTTASLEPLRRYLRLYF